VHALVPGDELIGEGEARHQATLLEPEDGGKGTREEDTFNGSKGDEAEGECGRSIGDPSKSPVSFTANARD